MKSLAASLISVFVVGSVFAQADIPLPAPVTPPRLGTPSAVSDLPVASPSGSMPTLPPPRAATVVIDPITIHSIPAPAMQTPASFAAPYNAPISVDPHPNRNCTSCGSCDPCAVCEPKGRIWGEFDYILWRARGDNLPPLVSTSPTGTPAAQSGVLGTPGARVLVGGQQGDEWRSGIRYNFGVWLNPQQTFGIQAGGFWLEDAGVNTVFASSGDPVVSRPFTNAITGAPASQLVALPGTLAGSVGVTGNSRVNGFDAALRGNMCCACNYRLDALLGYRYLRLDDDLSIQENLTAGPNAPGSLGVPVGTTIGVNDRFDTSNTFHGIQLGLAGEYRFWNRWALEGLAKASFGYIDQVQNINGATVVTVPGQPSVRNTGGLLALSSNIGQYSNSEAVIIPEVNLNVAYQLSQNLRLRVGYNFLYISSVTRPGNIIDTVVNPALIPPPLGNPNPARPAVLTGDSDYFLHGINLGAELRF